MAGQRAKSGKKNRKVGRNKDSCKRYSVEGREARNRKRRIRRTLKSQPDNAALVKRYEIEYGEYQV